MGNTNFGTRSCGRGGCKTCPYLWESATEVLGRRKIPIKENFTCSSESVIYVIHCVRCGKMYIGETGSSLRERFGQHRRMIENKETGTLSDHFNMPSHNGVDDVRVAAVCTVNDRRESRKHENDLICYLRCEHACLNRSYNCRVCEKCS